MNASEDAFYKAMVAKGFTVLRNGWPDFLCINKSGGFAVEVKAGTDRLREEQVIMHSALARFGIRVYTARDDFLQLVNKRGRVLFTPGMMADLHQKTQKLANDVEDLNYAAAKLLRELDAASILLDGSVPLPDPMRDAMWLLGDGGPAR